MTLEFEERRDQVESDLCEIECDALNSLQSGFETLMQKKLFSPEQIEVMRTVLEPVSEEIAHHTYWYTRDSVLGESNLCCGE